MFLSIVAVLSLLVAQSASPQSKPAGDQEQEVRRAENARRDAILRNDTSALDRLIANSFLSTLDDGRVVKKADELAASRPSDRKVESWNETDVVVRLYGDTAVVTGSAEV